MGDLHPDQLRELSDRAPEMDPDDFVANFQRLGLLATEDGTLDDEDVE